MSRVRHIFRWDLDKTYLKTEFDTVRDLVRVARMPAELRENIPGSAALIRAIRASEPEGYHHQIFFISGSPSQMRAVLEKKFAIDGFAPDGFVLKETVGHLLRGRFRAVRGQVAYKLSELLRARAQAPIGTEETLFGDDAENDGFIYALYAGLVAGTVSHDVLRKVLKKAGAYGDQIQEIESLLEAIVHEDKIRRILIHLDQQTPPAAFSEYFPLLVPVYNHMQTAIVLYLDRTLGPGVIEAVARDLLTAYRFNPRVLANVSEDILRRVRMHYSPELLEQLAVDLEAIETEEENLHLLLGTVAERARHLMTRPLTEDLDVNRPPHDYLALLDAERARNDEAKRSRKNPDKSKPTARVTFEDTPVEEKKFEESTEPV